MSQPAVPRPAHRRVAVGGAVAGRGHLRRGDGCEDVVVALNGPVSVVALADGAGTAKHARRGAWAVVHAVAELLAKRLHPLVAAGPQAAREAVLAAADQALAREAGRVGATPRDLASTLLFGAMSPTHVLAGQLGDGILALRKGGAGHVALEPARGEFASETVFVPTRRGLDDLQLVAGPAHRVEGIALLSDGAASSLCKSVPSRGASPSERHTLAPAVLAWWDALEHATPSNVEAALLEALRGPIRARTHDDCSVALLRRVDVTPPDLPRALVGGVSSTCARVRGRLVEALASGVPFADVAALARRARLDVRAAKRHASALARLGWA